MTSSAPLVLKWNDANTISVNKPGTDSSINFVNDGSTRKIGAYYTDSGASLTSFELSHGTQSRFLINKADGETAALYFETDIDGSIQTGNSLRMYQNNGDTAFWLATGCKNDKYVDSNMFIVDGNGSNAVILYGGADSMKRNGVVINRFSLTGEALSGIELATANNSDLSQSRNSIKIYDVVNPDFDAMTIGSGYANAGTAQEPNYIGRNYIEMHYPGEVLTSHVLGSAGSDSSDYRASISLYSSSGDEAISLEALPDRTELRMINREQLMAAFSMSSYIGAHAYNKFRIYNIDGNDAFGFNTNTEENPASNELYVYDASANKAFKVSTNVGDNASSNQIKLYNTGMYTAFMFITDSGDNYTSNELYIYDSSGFNAFGFRTDKNGNNDTNEFAGYTHNEIEYFKFSAKVGDDTSNRFDIYRAIGSYALSFLTDVGVNNANQLYVYNASEKTAFEVATDVEDTKSNQLYVYSANNQVAFEVYTNLNEQGTNQIYIYNASGAESFNFITNVDDTNSNQFIICNNNEGTAFNFTTNSDSKNSNKLNIYNAAGDKTAFLFETDTTTGDASEDTAKFSIYDYKSNNSPAIELTANKNEDKWWKGSVLSFYNHEDSNTEGKLAVELGSGVDMSEINNASMLRFYNVNKTDGQPDYALEYIARDTIDGTTHTILNHLKINSNAGPYLELATDGGLSSSGNEPGFGIRILEKDKPEIVKLYCNNSTSKVRFQLGDGVNADSGFIFNALDTTLGTGSTRNTFVIKRPNLTADAFMFSSTERLSNNFSVYNSQTVASTTLITNIHIKDVGIVLPLKFQSTDTTVPTGTNDEGICVFDSEALTATSANATKTAMLKRTVPSTYAVQQALGSILNIAPFELEVTTDAQGKGVLFRIKLPAAHSATGADQYYEFDFSSKNHGYNP